MLDSHSRRREHVQMNIRRLLRLFRFRRAFESSRQLELRLWPTSRRWNL